MVKQCNLASFAEIRHFAAWLQQQRVDIDYLVQPAAEQMLWKPSFIDHQT